MEREAGSLRFVLSHEWNERDQWRDGTAPVDGPDRATRSRITVLEAAAGLGHGLELAAVVPWARIEASEASETSTSDGWGDVVTTLAYGSDEGWGSWGAGVGMYWATSDLGDGDLPATSFSSGTHDPRLMAFLTTFGGGFDWQLGTDARLVVSERDDGVRAGSAFTLNAGASRTFADRFTAHLFLTGLHKGRDEGGMGHHDMPDGEMAFEEGSGGTWVYLRPGVVVKLHARPTLALQLLIDARIPVYQRVNGPQLAEDTAIRLGLGLHLAP